MEEVCENDSTTNNTQIPCIEMEVRKAAELIKDDEEGIEKVVDILLTDILICSLCSKQSRDIVDFLIHKSGHAVTSTFSYHCELCKASFLSQSLLLIHYRKKHRIMRLEEGTPEHVETKKTNQRGRPRKHHAARTMGFDALPIAVNSAQAVHNRNQPGQSGTELAQDGAFQVSSEQATVPDEAKCNTVPVYEYETMDPREVKQEPLVPTYDQEVPSKSPEDQPDSTDFYFVLQTEIMKGRSMEYGKASFKCLHCDFKTYARNDLCSHMQNFHAELMSLNQSIETREKSSSLCVGNQKLISMSQYEANYNELRMKKSNPRGKTSRKTEKQDVPGVFPCSKCAKVFSRLRYLRKHIRTHSGSKEYFCDKCGKAFKCQTYLTTHKKVHKEKLFKCSQCDFTSSLNSAIHEHRQLHSEGSVLCDICGLAYMDKSTLAKHKRVHDPARPFACTFPGCTWRFNSEALCRAHIRAHTTEGKFKCNVCGYRFRHKHHLQRHETKMHGIQHLKIRGQSKPVETVIDSAINITDTISFVVNSDLTADQLQFQTLGQHQLVVATDSQGTPITCTVEAAEIGSLNNVYQYQALIQSAAEAQGADPKSLDLATIENSTAVLLSHE